MSFETGKHIQKLVRVLKMITFNSYIFQYVKVRDHWEHFPFKWREKEKKKSHLLLQMRGYQGEQPVPWEGDGFALRGNLNQMLLQN